MTIAPVQSFAFSGIEAMPVEVQVQISSGLPAFLVVGLPDKAVGEARERVPAAIGASARDLGLICPGAQGGEAAWAGRIEVLAPTDLLSLINHFRGTQVLAPPEPAGAGKSMLAARLPALLPDLTPREALEVSMIHSVAGMLDGGRLVMRPPYREPHHSASQAALTGGGQRARPGEVSLAHRGVLFLDQMPEFPKQA